MTQDLNPLEEAAACFNPCFNGCSLMTPYRRQLNYGESSVSILVLMDVAL